MAGQRSHTPARGPGTYVDVGIDGASGFVGCLEINRLQIPQILVRVDSSGTEQIASRSSSSSVST